MRRLIRWVGILLLTALIVPATALLVLYTPFTQRLLTRQASAWLTRRTGLDVEVEQARVRFPLRVEIEGLHIGEALGFRHLTTHIRLRPLSQGKIQATYVEADGIHFRTAPQTDIAVQRFRTDNVTYDWHRQEVHVHSILLDGADVALREHPAPRQRNSIPTRLPLTLTVSSIMLRHIGVDYTGAQMSLQARMGQVTLNDMTADTAMHISLTAAIMDEGALAIEQKDEEPWVLTRLAACADSIRYRPTDFEGRLRELTFRETHGLWLQEGEILLNWHDGMMSIPHLNLRSAHSTLSGQLSASVHDTGPTAVDGSVDLRLGHADARLLTKWIDGIPDEIANLYPTETLSASIAWGGTTEQLRLTRFDVSLPTVFDLSVQGSVQGLTTPHRLIAQCKFEARSYNPDLLIVFTKDSTLNLPAGTTCQGDLYYTPDTLHSLCAITLTNGTAVIEAGYRPANGAYALQVYTDSLDLRHILPDSQWGIVSMRGHLTGNSTDPMDIGTDISGALYLHTLQWGSHTFSNATARLTITDRKLRAHIAYNDSLMQWSITGTAQYTPESIETDIRAEVTTLNLQELHLTDIDIRPELQCHATLRIDSGVVYTLHSRIADIALTTPTQTLHPRPLDLRATLTPDTALLSIRSGDLTLTASAHTEGLPWQWESSGHYRPNHLTQLQATLTAGSDNPVSNYLGLTGVRVEGFSLTAHYTSDTLHAHLRSEMLTWDTPQMMLQGKVSGEFAWGGDFAPDHLSGLLQLTSIQYTLPTYNLLLHTKDTLSIPLKQGILTLNALPLYTVGKAPLLLDGTIVLLGAIPTLHLRLTAREANLLSPQAARETLLYGNTSVSGSVALDGTFEALSLTGNLSLHASSSLHYIYKDAILTAGNQLDNVVTFTNFTADTTLRAQSKRRTSSLAMNINIDIAPAAQLEVLLGGNQQNRISLQGGGMLSLQYIPATGLRLSGKYTIETGNMTMNVPLLHVSNVTLRQGSTLTWSGNPLNPLLNIVAEERIRASVTLDGSPQSILFVAGVSFTDTLDKLSLQFTLSAPENAAMQNMLATLSPEEQGKLSMGLLTTGLYLGEGGTGNLMNSALKSILQAQLDDISRDAFRTVDVSVGIEPQADGVSGMSTRTDYSFSVAKRFWNNRIRIIIGGSITTTGERIEDNSVIDNISIEWRITPVGNQHLRFFYDKDYESILEGEIRKTGVGYVYRRNF